MSKPTLRTFEFRYYVCGAGAECLSYTQTDRAQGVDKADAQRTLARELGCLLSYLDEGPDCTITEVKS